MHLLSRSPCCFLCRTVPCILHAHLHLLLQQRHPSRLAAQRKRASVISVAPPADVPSPRPSLFGGAARKTVHWSEEQPQVFAVLNWQRRASETEEEAADGDDEKEEEDTEGADKRHALAHDLENSA